MSVNLINKKPNRSLSASGFISIEDYDKKDDKFIIENLHPYFSTLFDDLCMRMQDPSEKKGLDKVSFYEYAQLPGIINERLHALFSELSFYKDYVSKAEFLDNMTTIFIGNLDDKIKFTFKMYDFDNDGAITPSDIKLLMSYMPFNRKEIMKNTSSQKMENSEGLFQEDEGKNLKYADRVSDQEELKQFTEYIFSESVSGIKDNKMTYS